MKFSRVLRDVRQRMGLTQAEMSKKLGVARASLSLYETGKQTPDLAFLDRLHRETGMSFDYLMGYTDNYTPETLGMDKVVGLSTESLERLKTMPDIDRQLIDSLIRSDRLTRWAQLALRTASKTYVYDRNVERKGKNEALETSILLYERELGEETAQAIIDNSQNEEILIADSLTDSVKNFAMLLEAAQEDKNKELRSFLSDFMEGHPIIKSLFLEIGKVKGGINNAEKEAGGE